MRTELIIQFGSPIAEEPNRLKWQIGEFTFCIGYREGNPIAQFNILDENGKSRGGGSGDIDFIAESFQRVRQKATLFFYMTERIEGGCNDKGRWQLRKVQKYFSCSSEEGREKAIAASPKRCQYEGRDISHIRLERDQVPNDAKVLDLTSLYG